MGNWQLEVIRMALYVSFPVGLFHYFNQAEFFEDWIIKTRQEIFPPDNTPEQIEFRDALTKLKRQQEAKALKELQSTL